MTALVSGKVKLRLLIAVREEGEPTEVAALTAPMRITRDGPHGVTIHASETVEAVEKAVQALARALEGRADHPSPENPPTP